MAFEVQTRYRVTVEVHREEFTEDPWSGSETLISSQHVYRGEPMAPHQRRSHLDFPDKDTAKMAAQGGADWMREFYLIAGVSR